jgi:hypothetical protein
MSEADSAQRPATGQGVSIVVWKGGDVSVVPGKVLFDRGRGLVVESKGGPAWTKGMRAILVYSAGDCVLQVRGVVLEALSKTRAYVLPGPPTEMEKREYIRAILTAPARLVVAGGAAAPMHPTALELSGSGFRWFGDVAVAAGDPVTLRVRVASEEGRDLVLPSEIVRVEHRDGRTEIAGRFTTVGPEDRDAVLRVVFRARSSELGLVDDPADGE